jgi:hypothetical protein
VAVSCERFRETGSQRGSVLLAVVLTMSVAAAMTGAMLGRAWSVAAELRARRDVLCARYAALGGLALGAPTPDAIATAALVGPGVDSVAARWVRLGTSWCVLRATGVCGRATRTADRTMSDVTPCLPPPPP